MIGRDSWEHCFDKDPVAQDFLAKMIKDEKHYPVLHKWRYVNFNDTPLAAKAMIYEEVNSCINRLPTLVPDQIKFRREMITKMWEILPDFGNTLKIKDYYSPFGSAKIPQEFSLIDNYLYENNLEAIQKLVADEEKVEKKPITNYLATMYLNKFHPNKDLSWNLRDGGGVYCRYISRSTLQGPEVNDNNNFTPDVKKHLSELERKRDSTGAALFVIKDRTVLRSLARSQLQHLSSKDYLDSHVTPRLDKMKLEKARSKFITYNKDRVAYNPEINKNPPPDPKLLIDAYNLLLEIKSPGSLSVEDNKFVGGQLCDLLANVHSSRFRDRRTATPDYALVMGGLNYNSVLVKAVEFIQKSEATQKGVEEEQNRGKPVEHKKKPDVQGLDEVKAVEFGENPPPVRDETLRVLIANRYGSEEYVSADDKDMSQKEAGNWKLVQVLDKEKLPGWNKLASFIAKEIAINPSAAKQNKFIMGLLSIKLKWETMPQNKGYLEELQVFIKAEMGVASKDRQESLKEILDALPKIKEAKKEVKQEVGMGQEQPIEPRTSSTNTAKIMSNLSVSPQQDMQVQSAPVNTDNGTPETEVWGDYEIDIKKIVQHRKRQVPDAEDEVKIGGKYVDIGIDATPSFGKKVSGERAKPTENNQSANSEKDAGEEGPPTNRGPGR